MAGRIVAIGLVSATVLMWEVALTRLFSVVLQYHYVFLAVSLAVLGLGLGAVLLTRIRPGQTAPAAGTSRGSNGMIQGLHERSWGEPVPTILVYACSGLALALPCAALLILALGNVESLALYSVLALVPFALAGIVTSALFMLSPEAAGWLYGADLLGAGLGAAGIVVLLNTWGALNAALALGPLAGVAAVVLAWPSRRGLWSSRGRRGGDGAVPGEGRITRAKRSLPPPTAAHEGQRRPALPVATAALVLTVLLCAFNGVMPLAHLNLSAGRAAPPDKTMLRLLADPSKHARVVWTRWDAFARTDVVRTADPSTMLLFTDGGAGSLMYRFNGDLSTMAGLRYDLAYLPFRMAAYNRPPRKVLIIGSGGGYDILLAKLAGAADVTAVEINGAAVAAVRHFGVYDGHVYDLPGVHTIVGDGRNFVRRSHDRYDLIVLNLVYSQAAEAVSHALAENYVFTTEAFRDYIAHLTPRGYLAVTGHQALEALRAFTTGIAALQAAGVPQTTALKQVAVLMTETQDPQARPSIMLLKKSRMIQRDVALLARSSGTLNLRPLYVPYLYLSLLRPLAEGTQTLAQYLAGSDYALTPTSDNQPFFFNFNLGLPEAVVQALILAALLSAAIVALGWLGRHAAVTRQRSAGRAAPSPMGTAPRSQPRARFWPLVIYFALIGMGFMLAEVSLIQRFILLLGQPVLALVVVLTSLLVGGGLGSMAGARIVDGQPGRLLGVAAVIAVLLTADLALLPGVVGALVPLDLAVRIVATSAILLPLSFFLGIPFPSGIALARRNGAPRDVAVLWAVNAATSVLGSTLAVATAIAAGFAIVLWLAALCYVGAGLVTLLRPGLVRAATPAATPAEVSAELMPR